MIEWMKEEKKKNRKGKGNRRKEGRKIGIRKVEEKDRKPRGSRKKE
jgi:hypothetical protein